MGEGRPSSRRSREGAAGAALRTPPPGSRRPPRPPPYLGGQPRCTRAHHSRPAGSRPSPSRPNIRSSLLPSPSYSHELPPGLGWGPGRRGSGVRGGGRERGAARLLAPSSSSSAAAASFLCLLLPPPRRPPPPPRSLCLAAPPAVLSPSCPDGPPPPRNNETRAPGSPPPRRAPSYQGRPASAQPGPGGGGAEWHIAGACPPRAARSRAAPPAPLPGRGSHGRAPPLARSRPARRPPPGKVLGSGNKAWLGRELFARLLRAHFPSFFFFLWLSVGAPEPSICLPFGLGPGSPSAQVFLSKTVQPQ